MNMVQKTRPNYMLSTRNFKYKDAYILKVNEWKNIYHDNTNQRKAGITEFHTENTSKQGVIRDKEENYIKIK